ncbi:uncharacterized protein gpsm3 isoform X1 [Brachyhypopomus gauderio]|uniref:uncharacterized protein gpsm3 isoform X1 n=1 Tax=Brachyhypopomus gauderio TaxID=698409 RepID=UPI004042D8DA
MDYVEVKGESPVGEQLEPLLILEEGDKPEEFTNKVQGVLRMRKVREDAGDTDGSLKGAAETEPESEPADGESTCGGSEMNKEEVGGAARRQEEGPEDGAKEEQEMEAVEGPAGRLPEASGVTEAHTGAGAAVSEKAGEDEKETGLQTGTAAKGQPSFLPGTLAPVKLRCRDHLKPEDPLQKAHRMSNDFPDTLYELLCALQEGRRLNDQRCSFQLQGRRRCHSEPATPRHSQKGAGPAVRSLPLCTDRTVLSAGVTEELQEWVTLVFSSMTSLQREEFFELVATSQGRRLDDQRAELQNPPPVLLPPESRRPSFAFKAKGRKSSCKAQVALQAAPQAAPTPPPKEELYNMIVVSQAQGRLEEQRSAAPGPMDDEDFFSLLLKVQGGRLDEQRTELPVALKY